MIAKKMFFKRKNFKVDKKKKHKGKKLVQSE